MECDVCKRDVAKTFCVSTCSADEEQIQGDTTMFVMCEKCAEYISFKKHDGDLMTAEHVAGCLTIITTIFPRSHERLCRACGAEVSVADGLFLTLWVFDSATHVAWCKECALANHALTPAVEGVLVTAADIVEGYECAMNQNEPKRVESRDDSLN